MIQIIFKLVQNGAWAELKSFSWIKFRCSIKWTKDLSVQSQLWKPLDPPHYPSLLSDCGFNFIASARVPSPQMLSHQLFVVFSSEHNHYLQLWNLFLSTRWVQSHYRSQTKQKREKNLSRVGIQTWGCRVGSKNATFVLHSPPPPPHLTSCWFISEGKNWRLKSPRLTETNKNMPKFMKGVFLSEMHSHVSSNLPHVTVHWQLHPFVLSVCSCFCLSPLCLCPSALIRCAAGLELIRDARFRGFFTPTKKEQKVPLGREWIGSN